MKKSFPLLLVALCFVFGAYAQLDSTVYNKLKQQYYDVKFYCAKSDNYCFYEVRKSLGATCIGVCDIYGNVIIPPTQYEYIDYKDNRFFVKTPYNKRGVLDKNGNVIIPSTQYKWVEYKDSCYYVETPDKKKGVVDRYGNVIIEADKYDYISKDKETNNYHVKRGKYYGVLSPQGKVIIEADKYEYVYYSKFVNNKYEVKKGEYCGLIDLTGKVLVEADEYTHIYWASDSKMYRVKKGELCGLLDSTFRVLVKANKYNYVGWDKELKIYNVKKGEFWGVLDSTGKEILAPDKYTGAEYYYKDSLFYVRQNDKVGILDYKQRVLVDLVKGRGITYNKEFKCYNVRQYDKDNNLTGWTLYSPKGKLIFESRTLKDYGYVQEGLIAVQRDGLWGYMDVSNGEMVTPFKYTSVEAFEFGSAKVSIGNESFLISNPLRGDANKIVSYMMVGAVNSDVDMDIFKTDRKQENTFAVIITVENYADFSVPYAAKDGRLMRQYCEQTLGIPQSNIIYFENATLNNIKGTMTRLFDLADAYDGDASVMFYFAGQGSSDDAGNPYIMPSDAVSTMIAATAYPLEKLYRELGGLNVRSAVVLLDAGFGSSGREGSAVNNGSNGGKVKNLPLTGNLAVLAATTGNEAAFVYDDKGHGMFTYFLCKKIKENKGNVNMQELSDYVGSQVSQTASAIFKKAQTPQAIPSNVVSLKNIKL